MIDRDQRLARRVRERLAGDEPDHHPADQAGTGGRGDRVDVRQRESRIGEHGFDERGEAVDMRARRDLRHHAAIGAMLGLLPGDAMREDAAVRVHQGGRGFVAARFEAEDQGHIAAQPIPAPLSAGQAAPDR